MRKLHIVFLLNLAVLLLSPVNALGVETALTVTEISETPILLPYENADNSNGNSFSNRSGDAFLSLLLPVGSAGSATVTVTAQTTSTEVPGFGVLTKSDLVVALAVGEEKIVGPFPAQAWNDNSGNVILAITGTGASDVDFAALRIP